jgi:hypothetical protein
MIQSLRLNLITYLSDLEKPYSLPISILDIDIDICDTDAELYIDGYL